MIVFAFDRDNTVSSSSDPGPVPLALVKALHRAGHEVWAIGNQALVAEAGIPGLDALWKKVGKMPTTAAPTGDTAAAIAADGAKKARNIASKRARLAGLSALFPAAVLRIAVDDFDISAPGWVYLTPSQFVLLDRAILFAHI